MGEAGAGCCGFIEFNLDFPAKMRTCKVIVLGKPESGAAKRKGWSRLILFLRSKPTKDCFPASPDLIVKIG